MANKRIKDISTASTSFASDDFVITDSATSGTRKMTKDNLISQISSGVSGDYLEESNNLSDVASTSTAMENLKIPSIGLQPNEVPLSGMLNSGAWLDFDAFYETGTWVPSVSFGGSSTGILYSAQVGNFTRIGNLVNVTGLVTLSNVGTASGTATVGSLPFTSMSLTNDYQSIAVGYADGFSGLSGPITGLVKNDNTYIALYDWGATGVNSVVNTNFGNNSTFRFSATYQIA